MSDREASSFSSTLIPSNAFALISAASFASFTFFYSSEAFLAANYYGVNLASCTIVSSSSESDSDSELDSADSFLFTLV
jgi:hypothetical protein